jgi:hypothetical protein
MPSNYRFCSFPRIWPADFFFSMLLLRLAVSSLAAGQPTSRAATVAITCSKTRCLRTHNTYFPDKLTMGFIVQSVSKRAGESPYRIAKATKKDALDAAIGFLAQGMEDVTITDEKGQVYSTSEFVKFIENTRAT